jgi:hypothetical protein
MKIPENVKNTSFFGRTGRFSTPLLRGRVLVSMITPALLFSTGPQNLTAYQDARAPHRRYHTFNKLPTSRSNW